MTLLVVLTLMFCVAMIALMPGQSPSQTVIVNPLPQANNGSRSGVALLMVFLVLVVLSLGGRGLGSEDVPDAVAVPPAYSEEADASEPVDRAGWALTLDASI